MTKSKRRQTGAPCLCTSFGHGHDGERCEQPVTGRRRNGNLRTICDHCAAEARRHRNAESTLPDVRGQIIKAIAPEPPLLKPAKQEPPAAVTPEGEETEPLPTPIQQGRPFAVDPLWKEPF